MRPVAIVFVFALVLGLMAASVAAAGCSSSSAKPAGDAAADVSSPDTGVDVAIADAGPDIEQDPDVYPAKHHPIPQVDFNGGPVLQNPQIVTVTFDDVHPDAGKDGAVPPPGDGGDEGGGPDPFASTFEAFGDTITSSTWWNKVVSAYGVQNGTGGVHIRLPDTVSNSTIDDSQIQTWLQAEVTAGALPVPTNQTIYAIYYPSTTVITLQGSVSCQQFGGYHDSAPVVVNGNGFLPAYAVLPRCDFGQGESQVLAETLVAASHEFAEAVTDPEPGTDPAYYLISNDAWVLNGDGQGGEVGDICAYPSALPYDENGYTVQRIWSNSAAAASNDPCQPTDDLVPARTYYGAAVETQTIKTSQGGKSDGYVVVKHGASANFTIQVFSAGPLPHDLSFYVGTPSQTGGTTAFGPIADGVTALLSRTSGHNGNGMILSISVSNSAAIQDDFFLVRSVLENDDFHDWPVILHIE